MQFVPTRPPASRQIRAATLSSANPQTEATVGGSDARGQPERDGEGSASRNQWEQLKMQRQLRDLLGIGSSLCPGQADVRRGLGLGIAVRLWKQLRAATLAEARLVQIRQARGLLDGHQWPELARNPWSL